MSLVFHSFGEAPQGAAPLQPLARGRSMWLSKSCLAVLVLLLCACAHKGVRSTSGDDLTRDVSAILSGKARLTCQNECVLAWMSASPRIKALHDNKLWEDLAIEVSKIGYASDLTYFYLGRAAAGLGQAEAAKAYYRLALSNIHSCEGWLNSCDGFHFPQDIRTQMANLPTPKEAAKPSLARVALAQDPPLQQDVPAVVAAVKTGTGFFINGEGLMVTSWHVVENATRLSVTPYKQKPFAAQLLAKDPVCDLAVLKVASPSPHWLPISKSAIHVRKGTEVLTVGFPRVDVQGVEPKVTTGIVSSLSGAANDLRSFQISVPVQPGNSGGPLVTREGTVIGVVTSKLSAPQAWQPTEALPENVNYAIKSNCLADVLKTLPGRGRVEWKKASKAKSAKKGKSKTAHTDWSPVELTAKVEKTIGLVVASHER